MAAANAAAPGGSLNVDVDDVGDEEGVDDIGDEEDVDDVGDEDVDDFDFILPLLGDIGVAKFSLYLCLFELIFQFIVVVTRYTIVCCNK